MWFPPLWSCHAPLRRALRSPKIAGQRETYHLVSTVVSRYHRYDEWSQDRDGLQFSLTSKGEAAFMNLELRLALGAKYKSRSQQARVVTEAWASSNLYCPACTSETVTPTKTNAEATDFICPACRAPYQLKSMQKRMGRRIVDAGYQAMMRAVSRGEFPHLLVLSYSESLVNDLLLIPSFSLPPSAIEARKPLGLNARRAGWVGCNILLHAIPLEGRISLVTQGAIVGRDFVRKRFQQSLPLLMVPLKTRGWALDVLAGLQSLGKPVLSTQDAYGLAPELAMLHPENRHVREKIRQQLQVLRDLGFLRFVSRGVYELRALSPFPGEASRN